MSGPLAPVGASPVLVATRLSAFYGALFTVIGILLPFWPVWLAARGLGPAEIGIALSAAQWMRVGCGALVGRLADHWGAPRRMLVGLALASLGAYALFLPAEGFGAILAVSLLSGVAFSGLIPLGDALTLAHATAGRLDYGRVRLWGSLSFIAASAIGGRVLAGRTEETVLWMALGALAATAAAAAFVPDGGDERGPRGGLRARELIRHPVFALFVVSGALVQASHAVLYGFGTLHWQGAGHGAGVIGLLWAEGVVAEILLFAAGPRLLAALGPVGLIVVGGAGATLRWTLAATGTGLPLLAVVQALHALSFGATHLGAMHFLARAVPPRLAATAQGVYGALAAGGAGALALMLAGALYAAVGAGAFHAMAALALAGTIGACALVRRWDGKTLGVARGRAAE
ncbi:MAG: MFS transporter [Proteobacteria bacterium]|nr:MFS transporter [Pseudomonadota bacterium]